MNLSIFAVYLDYLYIMFFNVFLEKAMIFEVIPINPIGALS